MSLAEGPRAVYIGIIERLSMSRVIQLHELDGACVLWLPTAIVLLVSPYLYVRSRKPDLHRPPNKNPKEFAMNTSSGQRRFKRPQVAGSSSNARRRRSVSPEGAAEDGPNRTDSNVLRKKKKGTMQSLIAAAIPSQSRSQRASASGGESAEVARRPNGRHPPTPEDGADPQSSRRPQKAKRRERSQSRDPTRRASIKADSADEAGVVEQMLFGNTTSDCERLKEELDTMKKVCLHNLSIVTSS